MSGTALIIGASGDIGKEIAKTLLAEGYTTYLHFNRDKKTILELMEEYGADKITPIQSDLTEATPQILSALHQSRVAVVSHVRCWGGGARLGPPPSEGGISCTQLSDRAGTC
jgi:NADP-dependent 3-hydroxy acid dehydrogenase YdfG